ncbi:MAG: GNAT family N-acetyltransferase [Myxococcales bacterium]|nr:GNAT family N-acetyltransferase [Myxococcales bacterium]
MTRPIPTAWRSAALVAVLLSSLFGGGGGRAYSAPARLWTRHARQSPTGYSTFALGDTHGDVGQARRVLAGARLVTTRGRWAGGKSRLVLVGDLVNKGSRSLEMLRFARSLSTQARRAGGRVHVLLGNHEPLLVAAALATQKLDARELRQLARHQRALRTLHAAEPELLRALAFAEGSLARAIAEAPEYGYEAPLTARQRRLLAEAAKPLRAALSIMKRHRAGAIWTCFVGNLGRYDDARALARDHNLLSWLQTRPLMGTLAGDLLLHSDAPKAYETLGKTVLSANRRARRLMRTQRGAYQLFDLLTDRGGLERDKAVSTLLATYGGQRVIHGHTPHERRGPLVSARARRLDIDGSLSNAFGHDPGRGFVLLARRPRTPSKTARAKASDLDAIYQIERRSFSRMDAYDKKSLGRLIGQTFVVRAGGRAVADLVYEIDNKTFGMPSLYVIGIATHPSWRGRGLGTKLLQRAEQHAARRGVGWVYLHVRKSNANARRLYRKLGYKVAATERGYYHDGEDAAVMRKAVRRSR